MLCNNFRNILFSCIPYKNNRMFSFEPCAILLIEISGNIINIFVFINQVIMAVMDTTDITMATDYTISTSI